MPRDKGSREWVLTELFVLLVREFSLLLARRDPVGLTRGAAPDDEYDVEAGQIARRVLREAHSAEDVERIVSEVFMDYFGPEYGEGFGAVSQDMWGEYERARRESGVPSAATDAPT